MPDLQASGFRLKLVPAGIKPGDCRNDEETSQSVIPAFFKPEMKRALALQHGWKTIYIPKAAFF
ncbi:MAG: hypothetical protein C4576_04635 [Desulfobacteraceae bacterium]|nr:MAG: hypothetical protein C4576_04635 [Desulfobacteraceae bacterium]